MKNITQIFNSGILVDIIQKNCKTIAEATGLSKEDVHSISIENNVSELTDRTRIKKYNFFCIVQVPYFTKESLELMRKHDKMVDDKVEQITFKDVGALIGVEEAFMVESSEQYINMARADSYANLASLSSEYLPRYRLKLIVGEHKIPSINFSILKLMIGGKLYTFCPLISFYSLDDTLISISRSVLELTLARQINNKVSSSPDLKIVRFKIRIPKESPNINGVIELIRIFSMKLSIMSECMKITMKNIKDLM